jgi:PilZ domain
MSNPKTPASGADWTRLLNDPDLVSHLGELLQTYREATPDRREQALLETMRKIKTGMGKSAESKLTTSAAETEMVTAPAPSATPPFEPGLFTPTWGQDRRRYPRMKCYVAVELRASNSETPIWGNLANTSIGGAFVETSGLIPPGANVQIGLWLSTGKLWVKGIVLDGTVTVSTPQIGVRVKFTELQPAERETLRQFLKYIESQTKDSSREYGYLAQMKR